jgi:hypothetical protein
LPQSAAAVRNLIFGEVAEERDRQIAKWGAGHQTHAHMRYPAQYWRFASDIAKFTNDGLSQDDISWQDILLEEVAEAFAEEDWLKRRAELIQVMAVACAEIEDGDAKTKMMTTVAAAILVGDDVDAKRQQMLTRVSDREAAMSRHPASQGLPGDDGAPVSWQLGGIVTGAAHAGDSEQNAAGGSVLWQPQASV